MKQFAGFVVILFIVLSISGCGEGTYRAEKMLWQANNRLQKLLASEKAEDIVRHKQFDELIFAFREITVRYPRWRGGLPAYFTLANLYLMREQFPAARKVYGQVCDNFPQEPEFCAEALKNTAVTFERENNWPEAEKTYRVIIEKYPHTSMGLIMPLNIAQQYKNRGETEKAGKAFLEALDFYKNIIEQYAGSLAALAAVDFAAAAILNLEGEQSAVDYLSSLIDKYPDSEIEMRSIFNLARVYLHNLHDREKAAEYYRRLIELRPGSPLALKAREEINNLSR